MTPKIASFRIIRSLIVCPECDSPEHLSESASFAPWYCPECGSPEHSIEHLSEGVSFGPWYCDQCGCGINGNITSDGAKIEIHSDRKANTLVLLRLNAAGAGDVHIEVKGMVFCPVGQQPAIDASGDEYVVSEHTSPWNYLQLPVKHGGAMENAEQTRRELDSLRLRMERLQVDLAGSEERARLLLEAKNRWADRARNAEALCVRLDEAVAMWRAAGSEGRDA